jgi:hypothetical protein
VAIARGTTQAQIVELGTTPSTAWEYVVYLKRYPQHLLRAQAICTSALCSGYDRLTERSRDTGHVSRLEQAQRVVGFRFY